MSVSKSQALEVIRLCSEGVSHPSIAHQLDLPVVLVMQAVGKMRKAGVPVESPRDVRARKNAEIRKAAAPYIAEVLEERRQARALKARINRLVPVVPRPLNETPHERHERIAKLYFGGVPVVTIASMEGVTPPRVYAMLAQLKNWSTTEAVATERRIAKELTRRQNAEARAMKVRGKNMVRDARACAKIGVLSPFKSTP